MSLKQSETQISHDSHISPRSLPKKKFTIEDDTKLKRIIQEIGTKSWIEVAAKMGGRNARQCKERWENYLNPYINNTPFSQEEDDLLIQKQKELGSKWVTISHFFDRRTDAAVKNRWQMLDRKEKKKKKLLEKEKNAKNTQAKGRERKKRFQNKTTNYSENKSIPESTKKEETYVSFMPSSDIIFDMEAVPEIELPLNYMYIPEGECPDLSVDFV